MNISVIYVGAAKDGYISEGCAEFEKRIGAYAKFSQAEIKEYRISDEASAAERKLAMENDAKRIIELLPKKSKKIALCVEGKQLSSPEFAQKIEKFKNEASHIVFIIGGPFGLDESVKALCDMRLSLSEMTFNHRLARLLLLEQIYRALNISAGGNYHK